MQLFKFSIFFQMRDYWQKSYNIDVNSPVIGVIDPKLVCHFCVISCNSAQELPSLWLPLAVWGRFVLMLNLNEIFSITEIRTFTQEILQNYSDEENCTSTIRAHMRTDFNSFKTVIFCSRFLNEST